MEHTPWLANTLVYLAAAVVAVPLARLLGLGSIIGYLAAGIFIGPWGVGFVRDPQDMLHFAEFGVVLMLFLVGLELEPRRLWALRMPIFGWGSVQLFGSAALIAGAALALGVPWRLALVAGLGLALSSTAIGLGVLGERNLAATTSGQGVLSVALLQDVAAIPILALVPLLGAAAAAGTNGDSGIHGWLDVGKALGVIALIVLGGRLLLRPALRWIAGSRTPEIFTAASLLLVVATAALMQAVGLSMALGAFLAGVLLAESEYRHALETDIEPFKGLLLGLFFIAVGMSIDFAVVLARPLVIAGVVAGFLAVKALVLWAMARAMPLPAPERPVFVVLLAQGGEFGFVVFQSAQQAGTIDAPTSSLLVAAVAISMLLSPLLLVAADRWLTPRLAAPRREGARGTQRAAARGGDHRGLRPLRADRRPHALRQRHPADGARPRRRGDRGRCAASAGASSTATRRGSTCCASPAPTTPACWCSPSTTSTTASRWRRWCASTSRAWRSWRGRATCSTTTRCATSASSTSSARRSTRR